MPVGSIVFGPSVKVAGPVGCLDKIAAKFKGLEISAEAEKGRRMIADGVIIDGVKYRLVRDDAPPAPAPTTVNVA